MEFGRHQLIGLPAYINQVKLIIFFLISGFNTRQILSEIFLNRESKSPKFIAGKSCGVNNEIVQLYGPDLNQDDIDGKECLQIDW